MEGLTISYVEITLRLAATVVLCELIGFERETRDQLSGFRTLILLGLGAALFTLVSAYGFPAFTEAALDSDRVQFDPTRIAAQIVTGVGFLGAGAIIRRGFDVRGLTTAAAIGMASGAGYFFGAALTAFIVLLALYLLRMFRGRVIGRFRVEFGEMSVVFEDSGGGISEVERTIESHDVDIRAMDAELDGNEARYNIQLRIPPRRGIHEAMREIAVKRVGVSGLHEIE